MTPLALRTALETLIDDSPDVTLEYQLLTQAKNTLENMYKPLVLQNIDASQVANAGDTYLTPKTLPIDYRQTISMYVGNYLYLGIPFAQRIGYRLMPRRFTVDHRNKKFFLTGQMGTSATIYHTYLTTSPALTEANESQDGIILWPDEFQLLIVYQAAKILQGNADADDVTFRMSPQQEAEYQRILDAFIAWDADLKLQAMGNSLGYSPEVSRDIDGVFGYGLDIGLM